MPGSMVAAMERELERERIDRRIDLLTAVNAKDPAKQMRDLERARKRLDGSPVKVRDSIEEMRAKLKRLGLRK